MDSEERDQPVTKYSIIALKMVTKSTPNSQAKKKKAKKMEEYRQKKPCPWCGDSLNTTAKASGHTKTICQAKQNENELSKGKTEAK